MLSILPSQSASLFSVPINQRAQNFNLIFKEFNETIAKSFSELLQ